jgi:hypothetical protein
MPEYLIRYDCPECSRSWHEIWSCACDSDCECGCQDIQAADYELLSSVTEGGGS